MATTIQKIQQKGEQLKTLRDFIAHEEEENKKKLDSLKEQRDSLQTELLALMTKNSLSSLKLISGDSFVKAQREGIEITSEAHALKFAKENNCIAIDRKLVAQALKGVAELPFGFEKKVTEYISVRKSTKEKLEDKKTD